MEKSLFHPNDNDLTVFAETDYRGTRRRFGIKRRDRRHHMYILGKTGMGKSTLLRTLMAADLLAGSGVGLIDPHGDLADEILRNSSANRPQDTMGFAVADLNGEMGYNPLLNIDPARRHLENSSSFSHLVGFHPYALIGRDPTARCGGDPLVPKRLAGEG